MKHNNTPANLFTEAQPVETLNELVESLTPKDRKRMEADLAFVSKHHKNNIHLQDIEFRYRIGFALAVIWTRDNLNARPRKAENRGSFSLALYEPERSAFLTNLPSDVVQPKYSVVQPDVPLGIAKKVSGLPTVREMGLHAEVVDARRMGYALGWQDGSDYVRGEHDLPLVTTRADIEAEKHRMFQMNQQRDAYALAAREAALVHFDREIAAGRTPTPVAQILEAHTE